MERECGEDMKLRFQFLSSTAQTTRRHIPEERQPLPFKAYRLRDAPTGLTFNNWTLCRHCIYVFCIYLRKKKQGIFPHTT